MLDVDYNEGGAADSERTHVFTGRVTGAIRVRRTTAKPTFLPCLGQGVRWVAGLLGLLLLAMPCARAQEATTAKGGIRGLIYDADFNVPVPQVRVSVLDINRTTMTSEDGHYALADLAPGIYTVLFAKEGFQRETRINVLVSAGAFAEVDTRLSGEYTDMEELIVSDIDLGGATETGLLNLRTQSVAMMDAVGSDLMSRAGAGTAAAALRLVTGASVQDGKYAVIRGLGDRYTSTMLNGVRLPTADKERRAVQMDLFPAAMIESIQVTKTFLPDQQGDASGGGINIVTKSVPAERVLSASVSVEYDTQATGNDGFLVGADHGNRLGGMRVLDGLFWKQNDLTIPRGSQQQYGNGIAADAPPPNYGVKGAVGEAWRLGEQVTAGLLLNATYGQKYKYREATKLGIMDPGLQASNTVTFPDSRTVVRTSTDEQLWSMGLTAGIKNETDEVKLTSLYTHLARDIVELRYGQYTPEGYSSVTNRVRGRVTGYSENWSRGRDMSVVQQYAESGNGSLQLAGKHRFEALNDAELDWTAAYNAAESVEPDRRSLAGDYVYNKTIRYDANHVGTYSNETSQFLFDEYQRRWQDTREAGPQGQANLKVPFTVSENNAYVKGGVFGDYLERTFRNRAFAPGPVPVPATDEYDYSHFDRLDSQPLGGVSPVSIEFDGRQDVTAAYTMMRAPLPDWIDVVGGARLESTMMQTSIWQPGSSNIWLYRVGSDPGKPTTYGSVYYESNVDQSRGASAINQVDLLPALSLTVKPDDQLSLRLAYSETIARPTFKELSPVLYQEADRSKIFLGNPGLAMSNLKNYDLRLEWRAPGANDLVAASYFYKAIEGPIQYTTYKLFTGGAEDYIVPENYSQGTVSGYELEGRKNLGFLWSGFSDLLLGANATLQSSAVSYNDQLLTNLRQGGVTDRSRPMDGQPQLLANLNLVYENDPSGLSLGLFYNFKGETYTAGESWSAAKGYNPNIVELPVGTLDGSIGLKFAKVWRVGLDVKNLLDPKIDSVYRGPMGDLPNSSYRQGRTYSISLGCKF
jgi:outer membrane receptor protein involved in Fe transport